MEFLAPFSIYNSVWASQVRRKYKVSDNEINTKELRLVLGVGRSGTSWVANTLARSQSVSIYYEEPLFHLVPRLLLSREYDFAAIDYSRALPSGHRLNKAYEYLSVPKISVSGFISQRFVKKKELNIQGKAILIKEVHSLLSTEALLKSLSARFLFLTREAVKTVDSIFNVHGLDSVYLVNEFKSMGKGNFLEEIGGSVGSKLRDLYSEIKAIDDERFKTIVKKVFAVHVIGLFLVKVASENDNARVFSYEEICSDPEKNFREISEYLQLDWKGGNHVFEKKFDQAKNDPYSISRDTGRQVEKTLSFITDEEKVRIEQYFNRFSINLR